MTSVTMPGEIEASTNWLRCNGRPLLYDEACLIIRNLGRWPVSVSNASQDCYECLLKPLFDIYSHGSKTFIVSTSHPPLFEFHTTNNHSREAFDFQQHGHYEVNITGEGQVAFREIRAPENPFIPIWVTIGTLILASFCWKFVPIVVRKVLAICFPVRFGRRLMREVEEEFVPTRSDPELSDPTSDNAPDRKRLKSLDVFRGITMTLMLFVNYGGGKYSFFSHSPWNRITIADTVFPGFAWIMGASLILSLSSHLRNSLPRKRIWLMIFARGISMFGIGIMLNSFGNNNLLELRIPGVLQRLAVTYLIVGTLETIFMAPQNTYQLVGRAVRFSDIIHSWKQWLCMTAILIIHACITLLVGAPGCPKGYLGPGGLHMNGSYWNCTGGITGYIDRYFFGENHVYNHPTCAKVYQTTIPFDPEGLLGTLTMCFTVFLGVNAGRIIIFYSHTSERIRRWWFYGLFCLVGGFVLTLGPGEGFIPVNKNLWSLSFVLRTATISYFVLTLLYYVTDEKNLWGGSPFGEVGRNSILLYVGSEVTKVCLPWTWSPVDRTYHTHFLIMHTWATTFWVIIAVMLDRKKIYITL